MPRLVKPFSSTTLPNIYIVHKQGSSMKFTVTRSQAKGNLAKTAFKACLNFVAFCSSYASLHVLNTLSLSALDVNRDVLIYR